jgi:hypothetical protein
MKQLEHFLAEKNEVTIYTIASYIKQYIREQFPIILQENHSKLQTTFDRAGEYAYGVYSRTLFQALQEQLKQAGILTEPSFPGDLSATSIEYWGPPEERERCMWCVVRTTEGKTLGTIVTRIFHDHTRFRVQYAPGIIALEETENAAIIEALSHASVRLGGVAQGESVVEQEKSAGPERTTWEYSADIGLADNIDPRRIEISEAMLDHALGLWGRYGWELVATVPSQGRLITFFKRPANTNKI